MTERLLLRRWRPADLAPFAALNADPEVMRYFPAPLTRQASDALANRADTHLGEHGWGLWAVEVVAQGQFAGFVGLSPVESGVHFAPAVEIGWRLAREAWGLGYATEAAEAVCQLAFDVLALEEIVSFTAVANLRSRAVMERLGMTHDPADDFDHPRVPRGHPLQRHVLYRLGPDHVRKAAR